MNFGSIVDKYPTERDTIARLERLLSSSAPADVEYTLNDLCELLRPRTREGMATVLGELVRGGVFRQVVRVLSPATKGGIGDFKSLEEVPRSLHDWRSDREVDITPEDLRVIYIVRRRAENGLAKAGNRA